MDNDVLMFAQVMTIIITSVAALVGIGLGARVLWRWGSPKRPSLGAPARDEEHQRHLEASIEAIAIEVERISEAQRFMVGLLSDSAALRRPERAELAAPDARGRVITPH
jgi:hypothetical protein